MQRLWIVHATLLLGLILAVTLLVAGQQTAEARPQYFLKAFQPTYPKLKDEAKKVKNCGVCHYGKTKKTRNNYGTALHEMLGTDEKNVKDIDKVKEALKKIEKKESAVEGKTFGQLIEDGKLPATGFEPKDEDADN